MKAYQIIERILNHEKRPEDTGRLYRLMIYFAHSTMIMYEARTTSHKGMTAGEFYDDNKELMERVFQEGKNIMNYELSHWQMGKACIVYLQSKYYPQSVHKTEAYIHK